MTLKSVVLGLACIGFVACAGAQSDSESETVPTIEDVKADPEGWRAADPDNLIIFDTTKGEIVIELLPGVSKSHSDQFKAYTKAGLYDDTPFHRVIKGFMAQGGDVGRVHGADKMLEPMKGEFIFKRDPSEMPLDTIGPSDSAVGGFYNGFPIETQAQFLAELTADGTVESFIPHCKGIVSTARTDDPNSGNAQFFLMTGRAEHLDEGYTAKGRVLIGQNVVDSIKLGPEPNGFPIANADILRKATLVSTLPEAEQPTVWVQKTSSQVWADKLTAADQLGNHICDLPAVPAVME
ncbi:MAG: peptidylprolyl isomerase [Pseudomonadota bacterium]